ncbi:MAG: SPOR domain-containing protein [Gemmatimonadales bacterium]
MSKDYNGPTRGRSARRNGSSLFLGILVGLVLGLFVALGVAWYINKIPNPFASRLSPPTPPGKIETTKPVAPKTAKPDDKSSSVEEKPRFDFYKILPGTEEATPGKATQAPQKESTSLVRETFFLQAGSFQNAADADNLKARLALLGIEASVEASTLPDKGVWHRVRIGPYTSVEELNRTRDTLKQNGVQTTLVKAREPER